MTLKDLLDMLMQLPLGLLGALAKTFGEHRESPKTPRAWAFACLENSVAACVIVAAIVPLARLMNLGDYQMALMSIAGGYLGFGLLDKTKHELERWLKKRYGKGDTS